MDPVISRDLINQLLAEAGSSAAEICGLLLGCNGRVREAQRCHNVATDPASTFEVDPAALLAAHRAARAGGPAVLGHFHSHPNGSPEPSPRDAAAAVGDGALWLILGGGEARLFAAVAGGAILGAFEAIVLAGEPGCADQRRSPQERPDSLPPGAALP